MNGPVAPSDGPAVSRLRRRMTRPAPVSRPDGDHRSGITGAAVQSGQSSRLLVSRPNYRGRRGPRGRCSYATAGPGSNPKDTA